MQNKRLLRHPGIQILQRAMRRERYWQLAAFSAMLVMGLVCCCFAFHNNALITIAGLTFSVLSITALYHLYPNREENLLMYLLENQPKQIVWIYTVLLQRMPFGISLNQSCIIHFKLLEGDEMTVVIPIRYNKLVSKTLSRLLPHCTFGYTIEREHQFQKSPASLLRTEKGSE